MADRLHGDGTATCALGAIRSAGDLDFTSANIKSGINILGVTGTAVGGSTPLWSELSKETASDTADGDEFGFSVSVDGDTAVIGARYEDGAGINRGAAYVFERASNGTWSQVQRLTASDAFDYDRFGFSVSVDGDTAVIGAHGEDGAGSDRGAASVFQRASNGTWSEVQKLTSSDTWNGDYFGASVSVDGDTAVIGAYLADSGGVNRGATYVFERASNGTWSQVQKLTASDMTNADWFGINVSVDGDTAIIGAYGEAGAGTPPDANRGAAYFFERASNGTWNEVQKLTASDTQDGDQFGWSVAVDGDTAIIGANWEDGAGGTSRGLCVSAR